MPYEPDRPGSDGISFQDIREVALASLRPHFLSIDFITWASYYRLLHPIYESGTSESLRSRGYACSRRIHSFRDGTLLVGGELRFLPPPGIHGEITVCSSIEPCCEGQGYDNKITVSSTGDILRLPTYREIFSRAVDLLDNARERTIDLLRGLRQSRSPNSHPLEAEFFSGS